MILGSTTARIGTVPHKFSILVIFSCWAGRQRRGQDTGFSFGHASSAGRVQLIPTHVHVCAGRSTCIYRGKSATYAVVTGYYAIYTAVMTRTFANMSDEK